MTRVSLLKCENYSKKFLKEKIYESIINTGFDIQKFQNAKVAVKPNLLRPAVPEKGITTHPEFFRAVVQIIKEAGGEVILVECPSFYQLNKTLNECGYDEIIKEEKIEIADIKKIITISSEKALKFKSFDVVEAIDNVDVIVNLPKLKTHSLTYITLSVKNLFGTIFGLNKAKCHIKAKNNFEFSNLLLDLYTCLINGFQRKKEFLHIVDGILGMEGEGPGPSGVARKGNVIIAGTDGVAVDFVGTNVMGFDPEKIILLSAGGKRGLGKNTFKEIQIVGEKIDELRSNFKPPKANFQTWMMNLTFASIIFRDLFIEKPFPIEEKCTLCYQCKKICPAGAIGKSAGKKKIPHYDYNKCIRCYCCMEICPEAAIRIKKGLLQGVGQFFVEKIVPIFRKK